MRVCVPLLQEPADAKHHLQRSRLSWTPAPLRSGSLQALLPNWARCCRRCLLTLTANNVLLDDCALLKPERSQRLMKRSRKWRRMRDTDAGSLSMWGEITERGLRTRTKKHRHMCCIIPFRLSSLRREMAPGKGETLPLCLGRPQFQSSWQSLVSGGCILLMLGKLLNERDA